MEDEYEIDSGMAVCYGIILCVLATIGWILGSCFRAVVERICSECFLKFRDGDAMLIGSVIGCMVGLWIISCHVKRTRS